MIVPRFIKHPIDTSVHNRMMSYVRPKKSNDKIERIRQIVRSVTGIDPYTEPQFNGTEFVKSRQLFLYFVRKKVKLSLYATGRLLGKDHSTVCHAEKSVEKFRDIEKDYSEMFDKIENEIKKL